MNQNAKELWAWFGMVLNALMITQYPPGSTMRLVFFCGLLVCALRFWSLVRFR